MKPKRIKPGAIKLDKVLLVILMVLLIIDLVIGLFVMFGVIV